MISKDYFSKQAEIYAKFRPTYPDELFELIYAKVDERTHAWDCGTGNGQVAIRLAEIFEQVEATDISQKQLEQAPRKANIHYQAIKAERTSFKDQTFDLITVAQALHWFDFPSFYQEVSRLLKPNGVFAVWTYQLLSIEKEIDQLIIHFYQDIIGPYWASERKHIDNNYSSIPFPFQQVDEYNLAITFEWTIEHLLGYLNSWSSTQHYIRKHQENPIDLIETKLRALWLDTNYTATFPILLKIGTNPPPLI